jgi:citrate synthase
VCQLQLGFVNPHTPFRPSLSTPQSAVEQGLSPSDFVEGLKKQGKRVPGIGHRIKSKDNRDKRVELLQNYAQKVCVGGGVKRAALSSRARIAAS